MLINMQGVRKGLIHTVFWQNFTIFPELSSEGNFNKTQVTGHCLATLRDELPLKSLRNQLPTLYNVISF